MAVRGRRSAASLPRRRKSDLKSPFLAKKERGHCWPRLKLRNYCGVVVVFLACRFLNSNIGASWAAPRLVEQLFPIRR
jgi:hypothetical protein